MEEFYMGIKKCIENTTKEIFSKKIIVEFVSNVSARAKEITEIDSQRWSNVYESKKFTGYFVHETENHCSYILIDSNRSHEDMLITAYHEMKHMIDFYMFLKIFDGDMNKMINSNINKTFNIYSEYEAVMFGYVHFLKMCLLDKDKKYKTKLLIRKTKLIYEDMEQIENKYQFLIHSIQYFGVLMACKEFDDFFDFDKEIAEMDSILELIPIFNMLKNTSKIRNYEWFVDFDSKCRKYIGE